MYALASEHAAHAVPVGEPGIVDTLLWGVLPYVTILVLIGGTIWRYRTDQFSWTTRSSHRFMNPRCCVWDRLYSTMV